MESILGIAVVIFILIFIYKIGSAIWRALGVLVLIALVWIFRNQIMAQIDQISHSIESGNFLEETQRFFVNIWQNLIRWFGSLAG
jgi:hypothetical protein